MTSFHSFTQRMADNLDILERTLGMELILAMAMLRLFLPQAPINRLEWRAMYHITLVSGIMGMDLFLTMALVLVMVLPLIILVIVLHRRQQTKHHTSLAEDIRGVSLILTAVKLVELLRQVAQGLNQDAPSKAGRVDVTLLHKGLVRDQGAVPARTRGGGLLHRTMEVVLGRRVHLGMFEAFIWLKK